MYALGSYFGARLTDKTTFIHSMSSTSHQCLLLTIRNNSLLTIQDFAKLRLALGPDTHSSHTRRMFLECTLVASYGRSVLSRFFEEWKYHHLPALEYIGDGPAPEYYIDGAMVRPETLMMIPASPALRYSTYLRHDPQMILHLRHERRP